MLSGATAPPEMMKLIAWSTLQSVGVTSGYYLFNAAPYVLTLLIMVLSSSATQTSADQPAELTVAR